MILTHSYLKNTYANIPYNKRMLYESAKFESNKKYDIFISHSYHDKEIINSLYDLFEKCGYCVFIDWKDETLSDRDKISKDVALKLKTNMRKSDGLLYCATTNSSNSKWCPWELGYVDGFKNRVAILPILNKYTREYKGQEYLGIYPYITYEKISEKNQYDFWVHDPNVYEKCNTLKDWLISGKLDDHR